MTPPSLADMGSERRVQEGRAVRERLRAAQARCHALADAREAPERRDHGRQRAQHAVPAPEGLGTFL